MTDESNGDVELGSGEDASGVHKRCHRCSRCSCRSVVILTMLAQIVCAGKIASFSGALDIGMECTEREVTASNLCAITGEEKTTTKIARLFLRSSCCLVHVRKLCFIYTKIKIL